MRAFLAVAEVGSFSGAARRLGIHDSTISKLINRLEAQLNVELFQRNTKHVHLTEAGDLYFDGISRIIDELDCMSEEMFTKAQSLAGEVRVGISSIVGSSAIGQLLEAFSRKYPSVKSVTKIFDQPFDIVQYGVSVAIVPLHWHTPDSYVRRNLHTYRYALVANGTGKNQAASTSDPSSSGFLISGDTDVIADDILRIAGSPPQHRVETNNTDLRKELIISLKGIGVLPSYDVSVGAGGSENDLRVVHDVGNQTHEICLVYATRAYLPRATRAFIDHTIEFFSHMTPDGPQDSR